MAHYLVCSEEYGEVIPIVDGQGPMEYGCDVWDGHAKTKAEARQKAYLAWRDGGGKSIEINRSDGRHPMSGVTVEIIDPDAMDPDAECPECAEEPVSR